MYYCVNAELYDNGKVLVCITSNKKIGRNQSRSMFGMSAFKIWFVSEIMANDFANGCKSGQYDLSSVRRFYSDVKEAERSFLKNGTKRGAA
jgi:hypothetical protein